MSSETLTIRHDYAEGTRVEGTSRNSPAHAILKAHRSWEWKRYVGAWRLRSSRHRLPKHGPIREMTRQLEQAGYTVTAELDSAMPSVAQQEADRSERMSDRAAALDAKADKIGHQAAAAHRKATDVFDHIPMGQPILIGHHSETADRNRRERAWNNLGKSYRLDKEADAVADRAVSADNHMRYRYSPVTVGNRIGELDAKERRLIQARDSATSEQQQGRIEAELSETRKQLDHWRGVRSKQITSGEALDIGPHTVEKGDWVVVWGAWLPVRRVNQKSVTVPNPNFRAPAPDAREITVTQAYHKLGGHKKAADVDPAVVEAFERDRAR